MRKAVLGTTAAVFLACSSFFTTNAFADGTSSSSTSSTTSSTTNPSDTTDTLQGLDTTVLRQGADPNNPDSYAFLPPGMAIPQAGPRTEWPAVPSVSTSTSTSSTSTSNTTVQVAPALTAPNPNDPNQEPDIALGKPYTIGTQWPDALFAKSETGYADKGQLTDGQFASASNFKDPQYTGFLRQGGRSIVLDLGSIQEVGSVSLDFMQNLGAGIDFPDRVTYYASDDGTTWHKLGSAVTTQGGGSYTPQLQPYTVNTHVQAQYIRAQFEDKVFSFVDQFSVYGPAHGKGPTGNNGNGKPLPGPALTAMMGNNYLYDPTEPRPLTIQQQVQTFVSPTGPAGQPGPDKGQVMSALSALGLPMGPASANAQNGGGPSSTLPNQGYLTYSDAGTGGIKNLYLAYTGAPHNTATDTQGVYTVNDWLPYVAQEDASGNPKGWLFDGVLFGTYGTKQSSAAVTTWLNDIFAPGTNLPALDEAVGQLKQQLNDPTYKEKVVINIPGLNGNPSNFGSIDSSGQNLDLNPNDVGEIQAVLNKAQVIKWFIQSVESAWNSAGFSNLELAGFYWQPESVNAGDPLDETLIQYAASQVHQGGYNFFWIPTYGSEYGLTDWQQLGFNDVTSQAGVAFNFSINAQARMQSVSQIAQFYHIGLEMEQPYNTMNSNQTVAQNYLNHFYDYFTGGYVYGYEGAAEKTWYINSKGLTGPYNSTDPFYHAQYDNVVSFVNGTWTNTTWH